MEQVEINHNSTEEIISTACRVLAGGGLVVYPTETTYGIGVDATNQAAVDKLLRYKSRREGKPLSIAVTDLAMAGDFVELNEEARRLYANFLPGPMTVVSQAKANPVKALAKGIASERGTVGVRIPAYPLILEIIGRFGRPITASSANASYKKRPYTISDIIDNLTAAQRSLIDLVIDAGPLPKREPSTVVDTTLDRPVVLRQGDFTLTDAEQVTTHSPEETSQLGADLANRYRHYLNEKGLIFALCGEMGTGKTQLTKGVARALGLEQPISSPTYTLADEYTLKTPEKERQFVHIDTWRLISEEEFRQLGVDQLVDNLAVIVIEWADKVADQLRELSDEAKIIWLRLEHGGGPTERKITVSDRVDDER